MNFKRHIIPQLIKWKNSGDRKPLILRGARQVGKTTLFQIIPYKLSFSRWGIKTDKNPALPLAIF